MTTQSTAAVNTARQIIHDSNYLLDRPEFLRFLDRWKATADKMAIDILHNNDMTGEDREKLRMRRLGVLDVLGSPYQDRDAQQSVLKQYGYNQDELNSPSAPD